jgi:uncharacterized protein YuzB (UPF0349 family)
MTKPIIEFCELNLAKGARKSKEISDKDPTLDIKRYGCLTYCGEYCSKKSNTLYSLVNDEVVTGETPEQLVKNIYEFLKVPLHCE